MSWVKINDISYQHSISGALVQIVPTRTSGFRNKKQNGVRVYDLYVESRNTPKHDRVRIPDITHKSDALRNAKKWMKAHPNG